MEKPKRIKRKNPSYITASQAAEIIGLSRNAILWNIREGNLVADFDGFKYRIQISELNKFREKFYEE